MIHSKFIYIKYLEKRYSLFIYKDNRFRSNDFGGYNYITIDFRRKEKKYFSKLIYIKYSEKNFPLFIYKDNRFYLSIEFDFGDCIILRLIFKGKKIILEILHFIFTSENTKIPIYL